MSYTNLGKGQTAAQVTTLINAQKGADDGDLLVHNGSVWSANANKLLAVDTDGKVKTFGQLSKGLMIRGVIPMETSLGESSTTSRFRVNSVDGATATNDRGWWVLSTTSAANSFTAVSTIAGSANVFPQPRYGHSAYGLNLSLPFMVELDVLASVIGAGAEFSLRISSQGMVLKSVTSNGTTTVTCANTSGIMVGQPVTGTNCPAGAWVVSIVTNVSVTISSAATGSATQNWSFFGNPSGTIANKGVGFTLKGNATVRVETHDGSTATVGSFLASTVNTSYVNTTTTASKVHIVHADGTLYLFVNEVLIDSAACPTGLSTGASTVEYFALFQMSLKGNAVAHVLSVSNPRIYL